MRTAGLHTEICLKIKDRSGGALLFNPSHEEAEASEFWVSFNYTRLYLSNKKKSNITGTLAKLGAVVYTFHLPIQ